MSLHITGPCEAAYQRGCRCDDCRTAHRVGARRRLCGTPSKLSQDVDRLTLENDRLEQENAMLWCRLEEDH